MKKTLLFICLALHIFCIAQVKIGTDPTVIDPSSALEIESTSKGLLIPRMTTDQRELIEHPANGLIIFNISTTSLNFYSQPRWYEITGKELLLPAKLGSFFTYHSNGTEPFSSNTTCENKLISAGHNTNDCTGNAVINAHSYPVVLINGQCWMQRNYNEPPTAGCTAPVNTGCNTWTTNTTTKSDLGLWGWYNGGAESGASGWRTSAISLEYGMLYQWSAAMNGSTTERAQGVCPAGWHIPSDCEWMFLEHGLGMTIAEQISISNSRSGNTTKVGNMLVLVGAEYPNPDTFPYTNSSGFGAYFAGFRKATDGSFANKSTQGYYWTSTIDTASHPIYRYVGGGNGVGRGTNLTVGNALPVRCLKD